MTLDLRRRLAGGLRVTPWRGDRSVAYLAPLPGRPAPTTDQVQRCIEELTRQGYRQAITAAIGVAESHGFVLAGFGVHEHLHLLAHDLDDVPRPHHPTRRARATDRPAALAVDAAAFEPFWQLDDRGLDEALGATPRSRFRVAEHHGAVAGYAVTGRAGKHGFLQRLAVDPTHHGGGLGTALVHDALTWLQRRGVERCLVNTQERNAAALRLYLHLGFVLQPIGLAVLSRDLT